jgi:8-oxo-dGTP diphosphatase
MMNSPVGFSAPSIYYQDTLLNMRDVTLLFLIDDAAQQVLLAMKKRGFGEGKYNGVGGKVGPDETITAAAVREAREEIGVELYESDLTRCAVHRFSFEEKPEWGLRCHVFTARSWRGEPVETEEMAPQWFPLSAIPFEHMWVDDKHWLPLVLEGKSLDTDFHFSSDGSEILTKDIRFV